VKTLGRERFKTKKGENWAKTSLAKTSNGNPTSTLRRKRFRG